MNQPIGTVIAVSFINRRVFLLTHEDYFKEAIMAEFQLDFFHMEEDNEVKQFTPPKPKTLEERVQDFIETVSHGVIAKSWELVASVSGGKDSMTTLSLGLVSMAKAVIDLKPITKPVFHIVSSDTKMENLNKEDYLLTQFERAVKYGEEHGFLVKIHRPAPDRTASYLRIFAGSRPDPTPALNSVNKQCANDYKIKPIHRIMRSVKKEAELNGKKMIMLVGSRTSESVRRADSLAEMQASDDVEILKQGYWTLYPIIDWSLEDVWNYLVFADNDLKAKIPGYQSGFEDVVKLYSALNGGECVQGLEQGESSCGARDGCHQCGIVTNDKSGINQANSKELYHMKRTLSGLLAIRDWRISEGKNFNNRNFVSMVNVEGGLELKPNGYSGKLLEENLRHCLTIQEMEKQRVNDQKRAIARIERKLKNGEIHNPTRAKKWLKRVKQHANRPLLDWLTPSDIVWIDFQWSLRGVTEKPHSAVQIWDEVVNKQNWSTLPVSCDTALHVKPANYVAKIPKQIRVKHDVDFDLGGDFLNDPLLDFFETGVCTEQHEISLNANGDKIVTELLNSAKKYEIEDEAAAFICDDPSILLSKFKVDPNAGSFIYKDGKRVFEKYSITQSKLDEINYPQRHQNAVKSLMRLGVVIVNTMQMNAITQRLQLLDFTARTGLQKLAYNGGQAIPSEMPNLEFEEPLGIPFQTSIY